MKLWQLILLLGNCFHHWTPATADGTYRPIMHGSTLVNVEITGNPTNVSLSKLKIKAIANNAFDALTNVKVLDLSENPIKELPPGLFSKSNNLEELSLARSSLLPIELTNNVFHGLNNLIHLDLSGRYIPNLKSGYFAGLPKSVNITIHRRVLTSLSTAVFKNTSDSATTVEDEEEESWTPPESYLTNPLTFEYCRIKGILYSCQDQQVPDDCTHPRSSTIEHRVDDEFLLHGWQIKGFRKNWYKITDPDITKISIQSNLLYIITKELINDLPSNIIEIKFKKNSITTIKNNGIANDNLRFFKLEEEYLKTIEDDALSKLKLTRLYIGMNDLRSARFIRTLPPTLEILEFHESKINEITSDAFVHLKKLKTLIMVGHRLENLELGVFDSLENVEVINFSGNNIHELKPGLFTGLKKLSEISFGFNEIKEIHLDTFGGLNPSKLNFPNNKLEIIGRGAFSNKTIEKLSLQGNKISSIEDGAFDGAHIVNIDLSFNRLKVLKKESLNGISGVKHFSLDHNPLETIEKGSMLNLREARYVDLQFTRIRALENGMLFGLSTDNVDVMVDKTPITLVQGGVFDKAPEN